MNLPAIASQRHPIQPTIGRHDPVETAGPDDAFVVGKLSRCNVDVDGPALSTSRPVVKLIRSRRQTSAGADHTQLEFVERLSGERIDFPAEGFRIGHTRHDVKRIIEKKGMGRWKIGCPEQIAILEANADCFRKRRSRDANHAIARPRATVGGPSYAPSLTFERVADSVEEVLGCLGGSAP